MKSSSWRTLRSLSFELQLLLLPVIQLPLHPSGQLNLKLETASKVLAATSPQGLRFPVSRLTHDLVPPLGVDCVRVVRDNELLNVVVPVQGSAPRRCIDLRALEAEFRGVPGLFGLGLTRLISGEKWQ